MKPSEKLKLTINNHLDFNEYTEAFEELRLQIDDFKRQKKDDAMLLAEIAGSLITLGSKSYNEEAVKLGLGILNENQDFFIGRVTEQSINYCFGNG